MTDEPAKSDTGQDIPGQEISEQPTPSQDVSPLEEAKKILAEQKATLAAITEERKRVEKATAELLVNGRTFAGQQQKKETDDEKWAREAKIRYAGTGMDPT